MTVTPHPAGRVLPFARPWHVIREIDLVRFIARHARLARLCDRLEACADALPLFPSASEVGQLCRTLRTLTEAEAGDDSAFLDDVFGRAAADPLSAALLSAIGARRTADLVYAQDLVGALCEEPAARGNAAAETLGYMLRCFFTACRQTLAFEELAILTLGQHRLSSDARALLVDSLCRRVA